jgi:hypothetical protein
MSKQNKNDIARSDRSKKQNTKSSESSSIPISQNEDYISQRVKDLNCQARSAIAENNTYNAETIIKELISLDDEYLLKANPEITRNMLDTAGALIQTGYPDLLEQLFIKCINVLENHKLSMVADFFIPLNNLAAFYDMNGNYQARDSLNSRIVMWAGQLDTTIDIRTAAVFGQLAQLYDQAGHTDAAVILYRHLYQFVMTDPSIQQTDDRVYLIGKYGNALLKNHQPEAALELCKNSLHSLESYSDFTDNNRLQILGLTAQFTIQNGDLETAQLLLEKARDLAENSSCKDSPSAIEVYHNLSMLYLQQGKRDDYEEAERLLQQVRNIWASMGCNNTSEYAGETAQLANLLAAKGEVEQAEELYCASFHIYETLSVTNLQDFANFLTDAGLFYLKLHRPKDAVEVFQRAKDQRELMHIQDPVENANTLSNLATAYFQCDNFPEAILLYREAISLRHRSLAII